MKKKKDRNIPIFKHGERSEKTLLMKIIYHALSNNSVSWVEGQLNSLTKKDGDLFFTAFERLVSIYQINCLRSEKNPPFPEAPAIAKRLIDRIYRKLESNENSGSSKKVSENKKE